MRMWKGNILIIIKKHEEFDLREMKLKQKNFIFGY